MRSIRFGALVLGLVVAIGGGAGAAQAARPPNAGGENAAKATAERSNGASTAARRSIGALDPDLARYVSALGDHAGVTIHDLATNVWYDSNGGVPFITASSIKVAIMVALLRQLESAGRGPSNEEMANLRAMIKHSDNAAASALYAEVGDQAGMRRFASEIGLTGLNPADARTRGWGWSTITPRAMARLLSKVWLHRVLSDDDRALALRLMSHVESDQRWGVGTTAPAGAFVAMKNGWVPGPDGKWVVNSSGIVSTSRGVYAIAAYTAHNPDFGTGQRIVIHICAAVAAKLA